MQENFVEETANLIDQKKSSIIYYLLFFFSVLSFAMAIIFVGLVFFVFDFSKGNLIVNIILVIVILAVFLISGILLFLGKNKFYAEYDYTFVSGSISVSQVIKNRSRKDLFDFDVNNITKIGFYNSDEYIKTIADPSVSLKFFTSNQTPMEGKSFYYILFIKSSNKILGVFECSKDFIKKIAIFSNRNFIEKGIL